MKGDCTDAINEVGEALVAHHAQVKGDCTITGDGFFDNAAGCRINPFGDIGLGRPAGAVTTRVYCAGLSDAQNVLLTRDLGPSGLWQILA